MSFYLDRFIPAYSKTWRGIGSESHGTWVGNKNMNNMYRTRYLPATYTEEVYKGFNMIIVESPVEVTPALDDAGIPANSYRESYTYGRSAIHSEFFVYAWRIGTKYDHVANLVWCDQFADLKGVCTTRSLDKTIKMAKAKLDVFDKAYEVHQRLIEGANERSYDPPKAINAKVGDEVFTQAFGRKRKAIVVGTTGSRFIIGYVTPTSPDEIKLKTLYLWQIYEGVSQ